MMYENYLEHHGIKGMRWGIRRYQNKDGTLTEAGKKKYASREDTIKSYNQSIQRTKGYIKSHKKDLADLDKNGSNSKVFKKAYGNDVNADPKSLGFRDKKEMRDVLKIDIDSDINENQKNIVEYSKRIKAIKNTPINKLTYEETQNRTRGKARASMILSSAASVAIPSLLYNKGYITGSSAILMAGLGTANGLINSANLYYKIDSREYKKRFGG